LTIGRSEGAAGLETTEEVTEADGEAAGELVGLDIVDGALETTSEGEEVGGELVAGSFEREEESGRELESAIICDECGKVRSSRDSGGICIERETVGVGTEDDRMEVEEIVEVASLFDSVGGTGALVVCVDGAAAGVVLVCV
jgi:hypothetical protein